MPHAKLKSGQRLYYEITGNGPPLLLIMGTGLDHSCWNLQIPTYSKHFKCIVFDNRGTGRSSHSKIDVTVKDMAQDTTELLDHIGIDSCHISGLSLGSCIAQELALAMPSKVRSLQLHGTWSRTEGYAARKFRSQIRILETLSMREFYEISMLWFLTPEYMISHPEKVEERIESIVKSAPRREMLIAQYIANLNHRSIDRIGKIKAPTLVTVGSDDTALPPLYSKETADAIPGAEFVIIDGSSHLHNTEQPELFNKITLDFLFKNT